MKTKTLVLCAVFAALTAALAQAAVPIGAVPVNLAHVAIFLAAGLLGAKYGALSQLVYLLLGAAGVPVFSGLRGGINVLAGPTGGFLIGYVLCAVTTGLLIGKRGASARRLIPAMAAGMLATYLPGTGWFVWQQQTTVSAALSACVLPFLPGDILKIILCAFLIPRLRTALRLAEPVR